MGVRTIAAMTDVLGESNITAREEE